MSWDEQDWATMPQAGEVWEFTGPILGHGYVFIEGDGSLWVIFRAGGAQPLEDCWPAQRLWTGNE